MFAIAVADLDAMRAELNGRGLDLSAIRVDEWDGKKYRVFFLREAENGYCFSPPAGGGTPTGEVVRGEARGAGP